MDVVVACLVFYLVVSTPKRLREAEAVSQSREAPALSVMASALLEATHSRTRTMLLLKSSDGTVEGALVRVRRSALLGEDLRAAVEQHAGSLASYSALNVIRAGATMPAKAIHEGDEEIQGLASASQLAEESKVPLFTAVSFFTPMMLLLYAVFSHLSGAAGLAELVAVQLVILDIAFHFSSPGGKDFK